MIPKEAKEVLDEQSAKEQAQSTIAGIVGQAAAKPVTKYAYKVMMEDGSKYTWHSGNMKETVGVMPNVSVLGDNVFLITTCGKFLNFKYVYFIQQEGLVAEAVNETPQ